jgi:[acyl-carrier-protein] S-malonyltransferase
MGKSLYENSAGAQRIFDLAGEEIKTWCFEGTKDILRQTNITQPCIYTVELAAYEAFLEALSDLPEPQRDVIEIAAMAGFSLGEYSALTAGGVISDFQVGLNIVKSRGEWMSQAGKDEKGENKGGMVAAFGERERIIQCVEKARGTGILEAVNFNSPIQTVVAGDKEAMKRFRAEAKDFGQIKAVPLSVSAAFHSPMMEPAVEKLQELLSQTELHQPSTKIFANITGRDLMAGYKEGSGELSTPGQWITDVMARQAKSPVYWQETIENMVEDGIDIFVELGPGTTLSGLAKKTNGAVETMNVQDVESLTITIERLKELIEERGV